MLGDYQGAVDLLDDVIFQHLESRVAWATGILDGGARSPTCPMTAHFPPRSVPVRRVNVAELSKPGFAFGNVPMVIEAALPVDWNARTWPANACGDGEALVRPLETDESSQYLLNRWTARELPPQRP